MLEVLGGWVSNLVIFLLAAFLLELLLPSSVFQKYTRVVLSFILMLIIIEPIVQLTNENYEAEWERQMNQIFAASYSSENMEEKIKMKKNEIEMGQDAYISEQVTDQLKEQAEDTVKKRWGWEVKEVALQWEENRDKNVKQLEDVSVSVQLARSEEVEKEGPIEPVNIQIEENIEKKETSNHTTKEILIFLEQTWGIPSEQIQLEVDEEGGW